MRILALPRNPNPYQRLLYHELGRLGARVRYVGELTPSHTLNLLLLPLELVAHRSRDWRVLHLHWVFAFAVPGARRLPVLRRLMRFWFGVVLTTAHALGLHVVWTAHNALPHEQVFDDDLAARRTLVNASNLVLAHSQAALDELHALGLVPRRSVVVPHGPFAPAVDPSALRLPGTSSGPRRILFLGRISEYKGVENLLAALARLPDDGSLKVRVAGNCSDPDLTGRLVALAERTRTPVDLRLRWIPDQEVTSLLSEADVVVLPFREATTSGSAVLAMSHARPVIVPDLPAFADLPDDAAIRYDGSVSGLATALSAIGRSPSERLRSMSAAASKHAADGTWAEAARLTVSALAAVDEPAQAPPL